MKRIVFVLLMILAVLRLSFAGDTTSRGVKLADAKGKHSASLTFTTFTYPGSTTTGAFGINSSGQIVGWYTDPSGYHGYLLSGGVFTPIDYPGSAWTEASGINDAGEIVGEYSTDMTNWHGFLLSGGTFTPLDVSGASTTAAFGINNAGNIVGTYYTGYDNGFLYSGGNYSRIYVPGSVYTAGYGINNAGNIVGGDARNSQYWYDGFLFDGVNYDVFDYPGAFFTDASGINDAGVIVGRWCPTSCVLNNHHGYIYASGQNTYVSVDFPGAASTETFGINNNGQIVGDWIDANGIRYGLLISAPAVGLSPTSLDFGVQGLNIPNTPLPVTLTNTGGEPLSIASIMVTGANGSDFYESDTCPRSPDTLAPGDRCTITVVFSPTGTGMRNADVTITDDALDGQQMVPLTGIGIGGKVRPK